MNNTQWPLNKWIMDKVMAALKKEGCTENKLQPSADGLKLTFTDSFGFVYEMDIKTVSRLSTNYDEVNFYDKGVSSSTSK